MHKNNHRYRVARGARHGNPFHGGEPHPRILLDQAVEKAVQGGEVLVLVRRIHVVLQGQIQGGNNLAGLIPVYNGPVPHYNRPRDAHRHQ